ncbi:MAG: Stealth CR1 domain-containing protein [Lachnospiraceae bacterium]|nr:Stealth CR1 domain-containing protein [Lachnospiraceae bacterium]
MQDNKIDFVIIWVDGNDPEWRKVKNQYDPNASQDDRDIRYRDWDNLQYWFRAVEKFTPWVNKIHFVTWGHLPKWLDTSNPKLHIVKHEDYIPAEYLPTFNSHTIELNLHRIEGLAEQFVYFNDDMFINAPMEPEDFFVDGKPCDTFALNAIYFGKDSAGFYNGNDLCMINDHFNFKAEKKKNFKNWIKPMYGIRLLYRTIVLSQWNWFPGFYYHHLPNSFLKSTYETIWAEEPEVMDATCKCKIRSSTNVNQWIVKFWQLASGNFYPRSFKCGKCYHIKEHNEGPLLESIKTGKDKMICINDTAKTTDFEMKKQEVIDAYQVRLSEKSSFEV